MARARRARFVLPRIRAAARCARDCGAAQLQWTTAQCCGHARCVATQTRDNANCARRALAGKWRA
eukprot:6722135-Lingulodinium_polyedra.AAC.1